VPIPKTDAIGTFLQSVFKAMALFCKYSFYFRFVMPSTLSKNRKTRKNSFDEVSWLKLNAPNWDAFCTILVVIGKEYKFVSDFRPDKRCSIPPPTINHQM
jgi:hypothetical protein